MNDQAEIIFFRAGELPDDEREAYLLEACGDDGNLRQEIDQLLADACAAESFFSGSFGGRDFTKPLTKTRMESAGDQIGPYLLIRELGEGGFGVVWEANQSKPISRRVALKVIKAGMDTEEVLQRFEAERQALARMDHPHIAKVLDAGATPNGRPYFSMELVDGETITTFCEKNSLDTRAKLALFNQACSAISHAHQKGIIHRDVKPSNVLVTRNDQGEPIVKVIDFGIAKAIEGRLTDFTLHTRQEQFLGTPAYMSPEQAGLNNLDIDTRSDIYALGVLLYELITGFPPFDPSKLIGAGYDEMRRIIREDEPPRASIRITTEIKVNEKSDFPTIHNANSSRIVRSIALELDWIVMKAMAKVKERRYDTVAGLADDVWRFLNDEPVSAKPPNSFYLLSKIAKRHRKFLQMVCLLVIILFSATAFSSYQAIRASKQAIRATKAEKLAEQRLVDVLSERDEKTKALQESQIVARYLGDVFTRPTPEADGRKITMLEALDAATAKLEVDLADQPLLKVNLLKVLADTYQKLGIVKKSLELRRKAFQILKAQGDDHLDEALEISNYLADHLNYVGLYEDARDLSKEEFELRKKHHGLHDLRTINTLDSYALNSFRSGEYLKAIDLQRELIRHLSVMPDESSYLNDATEELFYYCKNSGHLELKNEILDELRKISNSPSSIVTKDAPLKDLNKELQERMQKLSESEVQFGNLNVHTIKSRQDVADTLAALSRFEEALVIQETVTQHTKELYGDTHNEYVNSLDKLMDYNVRTTRWDESKRIRDEIARIRITTFGSNYYDSLHFQSGRILNLSFDNQKTASQGVKVAEEYLPIIRRVMGPNSRTYYNALSHYARCLASSGRSRDAINAFMECGPKMPDDSYVILILASLQRWFGMDDGYEMNRAMMFDYTKNNRHRFKGNCHNLERSMLICALLPLKTKEQVNEIRLNLAHCEAYLNSPQYKARMSQGEDEGISWSKTIHGVVYFRLGEYEKSIECFDQAILHAENIPKNDIGYKWYTSMIAMYRPMILQAMGKTNEAKALFLKNVESIELCEDVNEPYTRVNFHQSREISVFLAHREAANIFGVKSPLPDGFQSTKTN